MIMIRFDDLESKRRALGFLAGRFAFKSWSSGEMAVPEAALAHLATELETSSELRERGERFKHDVLSQEQLREWVASLWSDLKGGLRAQAAAPHSELRTRLAGAIAALGQRLADDAVLADRVQAGLEGVVRSLAEQFDGEIAALVTATIDRWDADETARRLELLLGPDLQYIRINGTVVGGLAGLGLHALAQLIH